MAQAAKRAGRATTEGIVGYRIEDGVGTMVARRLRDGARLQERRVRRRSAKSVLEAVHATGPRRREALEEERVDLVREARREHRRCRRPSVTRRGTARSSTRYTHPPANKIGVLVKLEGGDEELARQMAMHISFAAPRVDDPRGGSRPRWSRPSSRSTSNSDELQGEAGAGEGEDRRGHARRSASSPRSRAVHSPSSRGSTTRRRRWARLSPRPGARGGGFPAPVCRRIGP